MEQVTKAKIMKHVYANVTDLVTYILDMGDHGAPIRDSDVENMEYLCPSCGSDHITKVKVEDIVTKSNGFFECPVCGYDHETKDDAVDCCAYDVPEIYHCSACETSYVDSDELTNDIVCGEQWWIVSPELYDILNEHNEHVICGQDGNHYWGTDTDVPLLENEILLACLTDIK